MCGVMKIYLKFKNVVVSTETRQLDAELWAGV